MSKRKSNQIIKIYFDIKHNVVETKYICDLQEKQPENEYRQISLVSGEDMQVSLPAPTPRKPFPTSISNLIPSYTRASSTFSLIWNIWSVGVYSKRFSPAWGFLYYLLAREPTLSLCTWFWQIFDPHNVS